jgi:aldehyde:ferredoxin oxidoreductase
MKILRINVESGVISREELPEAWRLVGGSGLIAKVMNAEVPPLAEPLGPDNKLIVACGPLAGTMAPMLGRISVGAKSPLTLGIKEANAGGPAAQKLDRLGYRAIVVEGAPPAGACTCLVLTKDGVSLVPTPEYAGMKVFSLVEALRARYGKDASMLAIGPAGERRAKAAAVAITDIYGDPCRSAARGGLGAVMGAKGIKAIVLDAAGTAPVALADTGAFRKTVRDWVDTVKHDVACGLMSKFGTPLAVASSSSQGTMPSLNYRAGRAENFTAVVGETIQKNLFERGGRMHGCMPGCVVQCSIIYTDARGRRIGAYEYESIAMLGTNLGLTDPDAIAELKYVCDDLGVDQIEIGSCLAVAAEAGRMQMGDLPSARALLDEIEENTDFGRCLADGVVATAASLGVARVPAFKGQAIPGHDPRAAKGIGVTYATSPMGADHTAGLTYRQPYSKTGQIENSLRFQVQASVCDTFGYCLNAIPGGQVSLNGFLAALLAARFGATVAEDDIVAFAKQTLLDMKRFNDQAEFSRVHEPLPAFVRTESIAPAGQVFDVDEKEIETFWPKLEAYRGEPKKAWEMRINAMPSFLIGAGVLQVLGRRAKELGMQKVLLIADPIMKQIGRVDEVQDILGRSDIKSVLFSDVLPDPPMEEIDKAGAVYREQGCDAVVALGGGSSIDAGKAVRVRVTHPGDISQYGALVGGSGKIKPPLPPLIAIPTTSGTGSEVSNGSVLTDTEREVKFIIAHDLIVPTLSVIDPVVCRTMPPRLTVETGMDALGHCVEGYFGRTSMYHPFYEGLAVAGVKLIGRGLRRAVANGNDTDARMDMCMAAMHGGLALLKGLSLAHAFAHALGAHFHVPHGLGVGVGLVCFVRANKGDQCREGFAELARALNGSDDLEKGILQLCDDVKMSWHLKDLGLTEADVKRLAFYVSKEVALVVSNPVPVSDQRILEILESMY